VNPEVAPVPDPLVLDGPTGDARGGVVDWLLVALITLLAGWTAVVVLAYLPLYIGAVPVPVSVLFAVAVMILTPWLCYRLTGSLLAALLPVVVWFGVSLWIVLSYNTIMPNRPLSIRAGQWRLMLLLGLGSLTAAATIGLIWGERLRERLAGQQPVAPAAGPALPSGAGRGSPAED
jgi:hypothetical protein